MTDHKVDSFTMNTKQNQQGTSDLSKRCFPIQLFSVAHVKFRSVQTSRGNPCMEQPTWVASHINQTLLLGGLGYQSVEMDIVLLSQPKLKANETILVWITLRTTMAVTAFNSRVIQSVRC